jgi:hypothetical protein
MPEKLNISRLDKLGYKKNVQLKFFFFGQNGEKIEKQAQTFELMSKSYCSSQYSYTDVWCNVKDDHVLIASQTFHRKRELLSYYKQMTSSAEILPSLSSIGLTYTRNSPLRKL